jgi:hypothetical protein
MHFIPMDCRFPGSIQNQLTTNDTKYTNKTQVILVDFLKTFRVVPVFRGSKCILFQWFMSYNCPVSKTVTNPFRISPSDPV